MSYLKRIIVCLLHLYIEKALIIHSIEDNKTNVHFKSFVINDLFYDQ